MYLQMKLIKCTVPNEDHDNPLRFWKEQQHLLPNMAKLAKNIFCIPASSVAAERASSSAGNILSQKRTSINPSAINDIILIRSATHHCPPWATMGHHSAPLLTMGDHCPKNVFLTLPQAHTHTQPILFHKTLPTVEGTSLQSREHTNI